MLCCKLLYIHSSFAIILMGEKELVALFGLSFCPLVFVVWLVLLVPWVCLQFVIVVFPDHTHYFSLFIKPPTGGFLYIIELFDYCKGGNS